MKRLLLFTFFFAACVPIKPPIAAPPAPKMMSVHIQVMVEGIGLAGARADVQTAVTPPTWASCSADAAGHCYVVVPSTLRDSSLRVTAEGYLDAEQHIDARPDLTVTVQLQKRPPPIVSLDAPILANFCGQRLANGEPIFDIYLAAWDKAKRDETYAIKHAAGLTHIILSAKGDYHGTNPFDFTREPARLVALIKEVMANGFRVVLFLSSGDGGTGDDADAYFGFLLDSMQGYQDECHLVPGWEVVRGGWTTRQFMRAVEVIAAHVKPTTPIWFHGSDGRATFASYPLEADDPTYGDEAGAWRTPVGKRLTGLLYQSESGRALLHADNEPLDYLGQRGWRGRATEVIMRIGRGERGWAMKRVVAFELTSEDYYNGRATDADVTRIADEAAALGFTEFGNGIPRK